jgi:hypothetical protein
MSRIDCHRNKRNPPVFAPSSQRPTQAEPQPSCVDTPTCPQCLGAVSSPDSRRPRTSSPNNNSTPNQRTIQQKVRHLRHLASCRPDNIHLAEAVPVDTASVGHHIDLEADHRDLAGLVDKGLGFHRSNPARRHLGCSMKVARRQEQVQRHSEWALVTEGTGEARLGPAGALV